jgi:O-antigen/teichoic acid export membrane protein
VQAIVVAAGAVALTAAFGLAGAVASLALAHVLAAAALAVRTPRALRRAPVSPSERNLGAAVRFGVKTWGANALQLLNYRLDLFVLNAVAAGAVVGRYSIAVAVTSLVWLLPRALSGVLLPRVAALAGHSDRDAVETKSARHAVVLVAASALVVAVGLLLVPLVYGRDFAPAIGLGLILLPGAALLGVANVLMATVVGRGRPGLSLAGSLVSVPVSAALYLLLIPPFGAPAAALASSLSYALSFALSAVFYRRVTGASLRARLVPTRDELEDYRRLWLTARAARRGRGAPTRPTAAPASAGAAPRPEPAAAPGSPGRRA